MASPIFSCAAREEKHYLIFNSFMMVAFERTATAAAV
jgi:hypothetical protein